MPLAPGTRLDRYQVLALLGTGGMGEVYLASDSRLDRKVALKLLPSHLANDAARMRRFIREARAASSLNHPNILVVHEIVDGPQPIIVTEYVEGVTLRERLSDGPLPVAAALDVAVQLASAVSAAHAAGVVHRDIKPANIMLRPDGVVKVLDFGLARIAHGESDPSTHASAQAGTSAASTLDIDTGLSAGLVLGTVGYMSPEQARGQRVDARSDVFSLGVVLYEMLAGEAPFYRETTPDSIAALLMTDPPLLGAYRPDVPEDLEWILRRALAKQPDDRYPTATELWSDLAALKRIVESAPASDAIGPAILAHPTHALHATTHGTHGAPGASRPNGGVGRWSPARAVDRLRQHTLAVTAVVMLLAAAVVMLLSYSNRAAAALNDKDTILIADFENTTGDAVFDGALKQGLAVQLSQSPFLDLVPDARIQQTLRLMGRGPETPVTRDVAREIGQRRGLKAFVAGSITRFDRSYSIVLEAIAVATGESLAITQVRAEGKDDILNALSLAAADLRARLGESLSTIERFDASLEVTTRSLEALKVFSLGNQHMGRGEYRAALPYLERAVELDPNFAHAWLSRAIAHFNIGERGLAQQFASNAFALRDYLSEVEQLRVTVVYHGLVTGDVQAGLSASEIYKRMYPRDFRPPANLAAGLNLLGEYEKALDESRDAIRLNADVAAPHVNLTHALLALGRVAEAKQAAEEAMRRNLASAELPWMLFAIAFLSGDVDGMQRHVAWAHERLDEHVVLDWRARAAAARGHWGQARALTRRAIDLASQGRAQELAARYAASGAIRDAVYGDCRAVRSAANEALRRHRGVESLTRSALALALCGDPERVQTLVGEIGREFPKDTLAAFVSLPTIRAARELNEGNLPLALKGLAAIPFERAGELWPQYVRGHVLLRRTAWREAMIEFQKIVDRAGQEPLSALHATAHVGLAEAATGLGDLAMATKSYDAFFGLWSDADASVPVLKRARAAHKNLQSGSDVVDVRSAPAGRRRHLQH